MKVTDPVCGMRLDSAKAAASELREGHTYYFCSASCHDKFKAAPDHYAGKTGDRDEPGTPDGP